MPPLAPPGPFPRALLPGEDRVRPRPERVDNVDGQPRFAEPFRRAEAPQRRLPQREDGRVHVPAPALVPGPFGRRGSVPRLARNRLRRFPGLLFLHRLPLFPGRRCGELRQAEHADRVRRHDRPGQGGARRRGAGRGPAPRLVQRAQRRRAGHDPRQPGGLVQSHAAAGPAARGGRDRRLLHGDLCREADGRQGPQDGDPRGRGHHDEAAGEQGPGDEGRHHGGRAAQPRRDVVRVLGQQHEDEEAGGEDRHDLPG